MKYPIANNAVKALLYEAATGPKPGLVDPMDSGPHPDMDIYLFIDSSLSLQNYFQQAELIGRNFTGSDLRQLFHELRQAGINAEKDMFNATNGVNTHKGAVFALGIFVCAESYSLKTQTDIFATIKKMCHGLMAHDLNQKQLSRGDLTAGEKQFERYHLGGARETAESGYPVVEKIALPFLKQSRGSIQVRLLDTFMKIATVTSDSNLIKRAGSSKIIPWLHRSAQHYLDLGGYLTKAGRQYLSKLDQIFKANNYSLGGCADLLIVTIFMGLERNYL